MDASCPTQSCTEQLWGLHPSWNAPWMETALQEEVRDGKRYRLELESKNIQLNRELGILLLQMHIAREDLERVRREKRELEVKLEESLRETQGLLASRAELCSQLAADTRDLQDLRVQLALLRSEREEREAQERLATEIWGSCNPRKPDASWDPPAVLLFARKPDSERPLSVGRVAADIGFKSSAQHVHRLGGYVRDAFMRAHGRAPEPRVFYDKDGTPDRVACFTERDRELIAAVVRKHGESDID